MNVKIHLLVYLINLVQNQLLSCLKHLYQLMTLLVKQLFNLRKYNYYFSLYFYFILFYVSIIRTEQETTIPSGRRKILKRVRRLR